MHEQNQLLFVPPQPEGTPSPAGHCLQQDWLSQPRQQVSNRKDGRTKDSSRLHRSGGQLGEARTSGATLPSAGQRASLGLFRQGRVFQKEVSIIAVKFPRTGSPPSPGCARGEGPRAAQVNAVVVCAAGRHPRDQHLVSRCFRIYKHIP